MRTAWVERFQKSAWATREGLREILQCIYVPKVDFAQYALSDLLNRVEFVDVMLDGLGDQVNLLIRELVRESREEMPRDVSIGVRVSEDFKNGVHQALLRRVVDTRDKLMSIYGLLHFLVVFRNHLTGDSDGEVRISEIADIADQCPWPEGYGDTEVEIEHKFHESARRSRKSWFWRVRNWISGGKS